ncbi:response regulator [bacterium]|nr:response regulator [bacterium]
MKKLLVVDDDRDILLLFCEFFESMGYSVYTAEDGLLAVSLFNQIKFDMIITDLDMPNLNGCELIAEVTKENSEIPIIVTSGLNLANNPKYREAILFPQVKDLFPKPINMTHLLRSVEVYTDKSLKLAVL